MKIDFSQIDNSVINDMALTLAIFIFGTAIVGGVVAGLLSRFRVPMFIANPVITAVILGCFYFWATHFLD
ncbi:hypothetical protein AC739_12380 [Planococcus glaciei]|uniref:hypothetical protein n=1 Tax=Planococcus glaciei TaxID=459472 RepID=UPI00069F309E|nr:hypothetical protein [Planococcus glaciei]KOF09883.1 hypothetical protein AC739_12380 [Planococcus glaciei]